MQISVKMMESLFQEKILLYQEMLECLKNEQNILFEANVDKLWNFSDKKQAITLKIHDMRDTILTHLTKNNFTHDMDISSFSVSQVLHLVPNNISNELRSLEISLLTKKTEVQNLAAQNRSYVEEYLNVIDDLMGVITTAGKDETMYDSDRRLGQKSKTNILLHKEV